MTEQACLDCASRMYVGIAIRVKILNIGFCRGKCDAATSRRYRGDYPLAASQCCVRNGMLSAVSRFLRSFAESFAVNDDEILEATVGGLMRDTVHVVQVVCDCEELR